MNPGVLLIADDLTGACDAAVQFTRRGLRARISFHPEAETKAWDVLAFSTESRDREVASFQHALAKLPAPSRFVFKKIDSTLRGNTSSEVALTREAFGCEVALVTPAFPAMGRVVEGGWLRVEGDPGFKPREVAPHFAGIEHCELYDAVSDADLDALVAQGMVSGRKILWAGSGGLAGALARRCAKGPHTHVAAPAQKTAEKPVFCLGSHHPVTLEQERRLRQARSARVVRVYLDGRPFAPPIFPCPRVLSGGDTAGVVCRAIDASAIDLIGEIAPGIPHGILVGGHFHGMPVVTKSGGFGGPDALIEVADSFTCSQPLH